MEEAARRASFTVLVPASLGHGWRSHVLYTPGREGTPVRETVHVALYRDDAMHAVSIRQTAGPWESWQTNGTVESERNGVRLRVSGPRCTACSSSGRGRSSSSTRRTSRPTASWSSRSRSCPRPPIRRRSSGERRARDGLGRRDGGGRRAGSRPPRPGRRRDRQPASSARGKTTFVRGACRALGVAAAGHEPDVHDRAPLPTAGSTSRTSTSTGSRASRPRSGATSSRTSTARSSFVEWPEAGRGRPAAGRASPSRLEHVDPERRAIRIDAAEPALLEGIDGC